MSTRKQKVSENENISHRVRKAREQKGWTQEQMGEALGVSRNYISMVEGGRPPGRNFLAALLTFERENRSVSTEQLASSGALGRLKRAMKQREWNAAQLAKAIGYQIGVVQAVVERGSRIPEDMARRIEKLDIGVSAEELLEGSDTPRVYDESGHYGTVGSVPTVRSIGAGRMRMIPLISEAQAGPSFSYDDEAYQHEAVAVVDVKDPRAFALKVRGNSMEPEIKEGDVAVVCPSWQPRNGDEVICRTMNGDVMCKIYQTKGNGQFVILSSYNPAFPPQELQRDEIEWIYPVQSVQKTRRRE